MPFEKHAGQVSLSTGADKLEWRAPVLDLLNTIEEVNDFSNAGTDFELAGSS